MGCYQSKPVEDRAPVATLGRRQGDQPGAVPRVKLVLLGDSGVGKSCLVLRYARGHFDANSKVTVGAAFMSHTVTLPDATTYKFEIWDTAGQERYSSLAPLYYRGASAALVVFDITQPDTFAKAQHWVTELQKNTSGGIVIVLVGNKSDLVEHKAVSTEEAQQYADSAGMLYVETSAKTAANVAQTFELVATRLAAASAAGATATAATMGPAAVAP